MIGVIIGFSPVRLVFEMLDERAGSPPSGPAGLVAALDPKGSVDGIRSVSPPACPGSMTFREAGAGLARGSKRGLASLPEPHGVRQGHTRRFPPRRPAWNTIARCTLGWMSTKSRSR